MRQATKPPCAMVGSSVDWGPCHLLSVCPPPASPWISQSSAAFCEELSEVGRVGAFDLGLCVWSCWDAGSHHCPGGPRGTG